MSPSPARGGSISRSPRRPPDDAGIASPYAISQLFLGGIVVVILEGRLVDFRDPPTLGLTRGTVPQGVLNPSGRRRGLFGWDGDEVVTHGEGRGLEARVHLELGQDALNVGPHGVAADA